MELLLNRLWWWRRWW